MLRDREIHALSVLVLVAVAPCVESSGDWPGWLPEQKPVCRETGLKKDLSGGLTPIWFHAMGESYSSPVVAGDNVFAYYRKGSMDRLDCLDRESGKLVWRFEYETNYRDRYGFNGGPRSTPLVHEGIVVLYSSLGSLMGVDRETGVQKWRRDLSKEYKVPQQFFGAGSSPRRYEESVIIYVGGTGEYPAFLGVDIQTGQNLWSKGHRWGPSYSTPMLGEVDGRPKLWVFAGGDQKPPVGGLIQFDLTDHKVDWDFPWRCSKYESVNASSPLRVGDGIFVSYSIRPGCAMVDPQGEVLWSHQDFGAYWMTPIHVDEYIYGISGSSTSSAELVCLEAATGKVMWREAPEWKELYTQDDVEKNITMRIGRGNLLLADGRFLCLSEYGHLLWMDLSPQGMKIKSRTWLFAAQETWTLPVISDRRLFVMQHGRGMKDPETHPPGLWCFPFEE